jgi:hypothetical protein
MHLLVCAEQVAAASQSEKKNCRNLKEEIKNLGLENEAQVVIPVVLVFVRRDL